jgi:hypothetical protein
MSDHVETLRQAAAHIREIAAKSTQGLRNVEYDGDEVAWLVMNDKVGMEQHAIAWMVTMQNPRAEGDARSMRLWHPGIAELVAVLLERWAWMGSVDADLLNRVGGDEVLALATAVLATKEDQNDAQ